MIVVVSRFRVANGMEGDVARAFQERPREVESAPGFLGLEVAIDSTDPAIFYLVTRWTDADSFDRWHHGPEHRASHAFIPKGLKLDPAFTELARMVKVEGVIGEPLADVVHDAMLLLARYAEEASSLQLFRIAPDGTIVSSNAAARAALADGAPLEGNSIMQYLTKADAARVSDMISGHAQRDAPPALLNFAAPTKVPYTLRCWFDVQSGAATIVGEPTTERDQALYDNLMAMNQELAVLSRERSREAGDERRAREAAEQINEDKNAFLRVVAHELRQPLTTAVAAVAVLRQLNPDPKLDRPRTMLERQLKQMQRLIEDLADTARVAGGQADLRRGDVDLAGRLRELVTIWRGQGEREGKPFDARIPDHPLVISADPERLQQVFLNIVGNAFKYTPPGGAIELELRHEPGWAVAVVRDQGEGIPPERLSKVFELFQRASTTAPGLGVGLAVVRGLVEAHGGTVTAESEGIGFGSTFTVRLPAP
jgi:signal transduction histidine kinase/heme-degrading monooxygenase HmoA